MITLIAILLGILIITGSILYTTHRIKKRHAEALGLPPEPPAPEIPDECCGQHEVCERDSLLAGVSPDVQYYDDEELDRFRGIPAKDYTPEDCQEFAEVFDTMHSSDVAGWVRSLQLRNIEIPDELKDMILLVISERRNKS